MTSPRRKGFADTSLDEIASEAGVTIRPIYHYFGSKLELFEAVNEVMEERIVASLQESEGDDLDAWRRYLALCEDPEFRRVVLVDGPNVLGRERWATSPVTRTVAARLGDSESNTRNLPELAVRMLIGALAEAALAIAESNDPTRTSREAEQLVAALVNALAPSSKGTPS
jgi:AcrR family transcriptional regulator